VKEQFLNYLQGLGLDKGTAYQPLLAVSGGLDSMVMAHLFQTSGFTFAVAHVNFQLRGEESDGDEQFVKDWCQHRQIPFYSARFETNNYATENKLSIQMAARELRYRWFDEVLTKGSFHLIATAHQLNDSLETVLINLARGSGIEGMAGIAPKSGNRIRPLLFATRSDIESYAAENEISWREDSSNLTDDYQRNFIRHHIVPQLQKLNPSLEETFRETSSKIQGDLAILKNVLAEWMKLHVHQEGEITRINKHGILPGEGNAYLWHYIRQFGFSYSQSEDILRALTGQPGKQFISTTHKLVIDRDFLILTPVTQIVEEVVIEAIQETAVLGSLQMLIEPVDKLTPSTNPQLALIDFDKVTFPLVWRRWKAGDFFYPLGMTHRKKISDFLIDTKISRGEKDFVTILESAGEIVWVVGHRIDNRFRLTPESRRGLSFFIQPYL
jgi:tRNA(Ile)-lysidine synthase